MKYERFAAYLSTQAEPEVPLTFAAIERVLGSKLPASARRHRSFWSNNTPNSAFARVWTQAGWRAKDVELARRRVVFERVPRPDKLSWRQRMDQWWDENPRLITVEPGFDVTQPAMPEWADMIDEMYGPEVRRRGAAK